MIKDAMIASFDLFFGSYIVLIINVISYDVYGNSYMVVFSRFFVVDLNFIYFSSPNFLEAAVL